MSFFMEMNGTKIISLELLREYVDVEVLLSYRDRFDQWLYGWDYEDESEAVADLDEGLSDDEWLLSVAEILDIPKEKIVKKAKVETSRDMEYDKDNIESIYNAACSGNMEAQYDLGKHYYYGKGISLDYEKAEKWYTEAASQGHEKAKKRLKKLLEIQNQFKEQFQEVNCNGIKMEMVKINAGDFVMGCPNRESISYDDVRHQVTITKDYWLGKYPVTQDQYEAIMGENPSCFKGANYPVENVSWFDAKIFCYKLNIKYAEKLPKGYRFDLPTEAQWEYACRAGTKTAFNNGENIRCDGIGCDDYCNNLEEIAWCNYNEKKTQTSEVGRRKPNAWGLYDMHGNVNEWCLDNYERYTEEAKTDPIVYKTFSEDHIIRGGSWNNYMDNCRSAYRGHSFSWPGGLNEYKSNELGFRLALHMIQFEDEVETIYRAALEGNLESQNRLGDIYLQISNRDEAIKWYRQAAEQGNAKAQTNLAWQLLERDNNNIPEGYRWLCRAIEQGEAEAQAILGMILVALDEDLDIDGVTLSQDIARGIELINASVNQNNARGMFILGCLYDMGLGVPKDKAMAVKWLQKADNYGFEEAKSKLDSILKKEEV